MRLNLPARRPSLPLSNPVRRNRASRWWSHRRCWPFSSQHHRTTSKPTPFLSSTRAPEYTVHSLTSQQIFPHSDAPWYVPGFAASLGTLSVTIILYASLPYWYLWEAERRKRKYGHAMPIKALEDASHAMVSDAARAREEQQQIIEEKSAAADIERAEHVEELPEQGGGGGGGGGGDEKRKHAHP